MDSKGTTLIVAPPADVAAVHAAIPGAKSDGQGGFTVPCTTTASVALTFGGRSFAIDPRDIAFLPATNDLAGDCLSGISSGQIGGATEWLVCVAPFLRAVTIVNEISFRTVATYSLRMLCSPLTRERTLFLLRTLCDVSSS